VTELGTSEHRFWGGVMGEATFSEGRSRPPAGCDAREVPAAVRISLRAGPGNLGTCRPCTKQCDRVGWCPRPFAK
jgi:hypothetical protein